MAWTAPMTAVAGSVFTAAAFNTHIRDNLAETAPAKATRPGGFFVTSATNAIAERVPSEALTTAPDSTTATSFGNLAASTGPSVTVVTGVQAFVIITADLVCDTNAQSARAAFTVSGATTLEASDQRAIRNIRESVTNNGQFSGVFLVPLTPGTNTFTMVYRTSGTSTSTFANRRIGVLPF
jgi:hypothetical protein